MVTSFLIFFEHISGIYVLPMLSHHTQFALKNYNTATMPDSGLLGQTSWGSAVQVLLYKEQYWIVVACISNVVRERRIVSVLCGFFRLIRERFLKKKYNIYIIKKQNNNTWNKDKNNGI